MTYLYSYDKTLILTINYRMPPVHPLPQQGLNIGAIKTAMEGISDEGILGKLKPVVEPMLEKLTGLAG